MTENSGASDGGERRRAKRYGASHPAVLKIEGLSAFDCDIRNFCEAGFYLSAGQDSTLQNILPLVQVGTKLVLEYNGGPKDYSINGEIARLSAEGMGVYAPALPEEAFRALFAGKLKSGSESDGPEQISGSPQLISKCRECLFDFATKFVSDFYEKAEEELKITLDEAAFSMRADYQHALNALKADPSRAQSGFNTALREAVEEFESGTAPKKEKSKAKEGELSLVDQRGFEEWLAVSSIAYRVDGLLRQEMTAFELRYARLSGYMVDRKASPYGPEMICRMFDKQLRKMELSEAGEEVIHSAMFKVLSASMKDLYESLNKVVESVDPVTRGTGGSAAEEEKSLEKAPVSEEESSEDSVADEKSEAQPSSDVGQDGVDNGAGAGAGAGAGGSSPASANDANIGHGESSGGGIAPSQQNMRPVPRAQREYSFENLFRAIQRHSDVSDERVAASAAPRQTAASSYFSPVHAPGPAARSGSGSADAGSSAGADSAGGSGSAEPASMPVGGQSVARALAGMRNASKSGRVEAKRASVRAANLPKPETAEVVDLLEQIEPKARSKGDGGSSLPLSRRLSRKLEESALAGIEESERQQLSTVADIMDKAVSEYQPTSQIESLVVALEKPLLKLVMVDSEFLEDEFHPARRFMNTLDQFAIAADDDGNFYDPKLFQFLETLIGSIVQEPAVSKDIFDSSLEKISAMLFRLQQLRLKRVSLLQESSEARERVRTARNITSDALDDLLSGEQVPVSALDLLDVGWRHHLNLIELRETCDSANWKEAFDIFAKLCDWLSAEKTEKHLDIDGDIDEGALDELLRQIELGLVNVSTDTDGVESLVAAMRSEILLSRDQVPETQEHIAASNQADEEDMPQAGIARIGEWWSVPVSGKKVITQLIWKNRGQDKYAATNRSASRRWELNAKQFEKDIAGGKISRIGEGQFLLFERSEGALFDDLYTRLSSQIVQEEHVGIVNRKGFLKTLDMACVERDKVHVLCMVEFDEFRVIRHNCGMDACEELSAKLLNEIESVLERADVMSAFAQDSFMILMQNCDQKMAVEKAEKILSIFKDYKHSVGSEAYRLGVNIGLAQCEAGKDGPDAALRQVDSACIASKGNGRNQLQFYDAANKKLKVQDSVMELAGRIDRIIAGGGLYLRAQMVMPVGEGVEMVPYHEILLGINDEQGLRVVPEKFIQAVERLRRTDELDLWVINKTFEWIKAHPQQFEDWGGFSINLSGSSLASSEVLETLLKEIPKLGVSAEKLIFEITETATIENYDSAKDFLWEVRRLGCKFSLDDFGTGYASYSHLRKLRPDILKIDGSFIWNLASDNSDFVLVQSMNEIGKALGFKTVAEYVESPAILSKLAEIGVDYAQGYAIHRPEPLDDMLKNKS